MKRAPSYATREFEIPAGGSVSTFRQADFLTCLEATAPFRLSFDNAPRTDFQAGLTYRTAEGFQRVEIINEGATVLRVTLGFGKGDISDSRLTLGGTLSNAEDMPDTATSGAPVWAANSAITLLAAANTFRRELIMVNSGPGTIYIGGDAAAAAGEGLPLAVEQSLILNTTAAIYARNDSGAFCAVNVMELERS